MKTKIKITGVLLYTLYTLPNFAQQFYNPLIIPPTMSGTTFNLVEASAVHQFYPGVNTTTWGFNGDFLGPTLIFNQGDSVNINVTNNLLDTTTVHWHGLHIPSIYDGGPHNPIPPSATWSVYFKIMNQASMHWYHPHGHKKTTQHVTNGLAGLIIIKDTIEAQLNLPRTYGVDDIPIILQDRRYNTSGNFVVAGLGDSMLVNGTARPYLNLPAQVARLRILNASTGRFYNLGFNDNRNFQVIGSDAGLLNRPYQTNRIVMGIGERYEILVDLTANNPGDSIILMSYGSKLGSNVPGGTNMMMEQSPLNAVDFGILQIKVVAQTINPVTAIPLSLISNVLINPSSVNRTRTKPITGTGMVGSGNFLLDGSNFSMHVINDTILLNDTEKWIFTNTSNITHPIHIHDISFFILDRNGYPPPAYEAGLKDVFIIRPNETVSVIMKFEDFTNDTMPYMYHCHILPHEDMDMMHSFIVVNGPTGISKQPNNSQPSFIYPNPFSSSTTFQTDKILKDATLTVYNLYGQTVKQIKNISGQTVTLFRDNLPSGLYFLRLTEDNTTFYAGKIVITD